MLIVWLVEDDYLQRQETRELLRKNFRNISITEITTEHEFRERLNQLSQPYPDLMIIDVMLPWTKPSPGKPPEAPPEVKENSFYRAGIRCTKLVREKPETQNTKILLFSNLEKDDLKDDLDKSGNLTYFLNKTIDTNSFISLIQSFI